MTTATQAPPAVRLTGITKRYPGVVANSDINLTVRPATVHALVGENGAGKSTLMKTLFGLHQPDEGSIEINGSPQVFHSPADAIAAGIGMVHQHFMLADNLTVWENVVLGAEPTAAGRLDGARARRDIEQLGRRYGLGVDPRALVEELGVGARQRVEIIKVLYRGARILILDEPTAVLVPQEVDELFGNLAELKAEGLTIIFISHKLDEVRGDCGRDHRHPAGNDGRHRGPEERQQPSARRDDGGLRAAGSRAAGEHRDRPRGADLARGPGGRRRP